jgi:hypothetical protein
MKRSYTITGRANEVSQDVFGTTMVLNSSMAHLIVIDEKSTLHKCLFRVRDIFKQFLPMYNIEQQQKNLNVNMRCSLEIVWHSLLVCGIGLSG